MPTLKGLLFNRFAAEGLSSLVEEMQSKYTAKKGKPLIISTGMGSKKEIMKALKTAIETWNKKILLLSLFCILLFFL